MVHNKFSNVIFQTYLLVIVTIGSEVLNCIDTRFTIKVYYYYCAMSSLLLNDTKILCSCVCCNKREVDRFVVWITNYAFFT